jgi:mannose-6-phosphate isomerase-like protein (cupin superfamily)
MQTLPARLKLAPGMLADHPLKEGEAYQFLTLRESKYSSLHILRLRVGGEVPARYHERHDLVICAMAGSAIVSVEESRFLLKPGETVMVPPYHAYGMLHHGSEEPFVAAMTFSPPYDPDDRVDMPGKREEPRYMEAPTGVGRPIDEPIKDE